MQDREVRGAGEGGGEGGKPVPKELLRLATDPLCSLRAPALVLQEGSPGLRLIFHASGLSSPTFCKA